MSKVIYLDSNQLFRVFERESDKLAERFATALESGGWCLAVSEAYFIEVWNGLEAGADISKVRTGLEILDSLKPKWLCLGAIGNEEVNDAFLKDQQGEAHTPYSPFLDWAGMVTAMNRDPEPQPGETVITPPMPDAILENYVSGCLQARNDYWGKELEAVSIIYRDQLKRTRNKFLARKETFFEVVGCVCGLFTEDRKSISKFTERLWKSPSVCPAFRMNFEMISSLLEDQRTKWSRSRFFDQGHAQAIPYVDAFVARDAGLQQAIISYDNQVLKKNGLTPYQDRCFNRIEDVLPI